MALRKVKALLAFPGLALLVACNNETAEVNEPIKSFGDSDQTDFVVTAQTTNDTMQSVILPQGAEAVNRVVAVNPGTNYLIRRVR